MAGPLVTAPAVWTWPTVTPTTLTNSANVRVDFCTCGADCAYCARAGDQ